MKKVKLNDENIHKGYLILINPDNLLKTNEIKLISYSEKYKNIGENLEIVGTVISNPIDKEYKNQYTLKVEKIDENKKYQNTNLQLNVKKELLSKSLCS